MNEDNSQPTAILSADQVSIDKHAVIEASAGTGKTFTLENLIIKILQQGISLEKILIVTFTEKASSDLLRRIRTKLEQFLQLGASDSPEIQNALDNFEKVQISTIHGFCQRILREYAFETGYQFELKLTSDHQFYKNLLHEIMRRDWPAKYGKNLKEILYYANFPDIDRSGVSQWEKNVISIARRFLPECGDQLNPAPRSDGAFDRLIGFVTEQFEKIFQLIEPPGHRDVTFHPFYKEYRLLPARHHNTRSSILKSIIKPLLDLLYFMSPIVNKKEDFCKEHYDLITDFLSHARSTKPFERDGFDTIWVSLKEPESMPLLSDLAYHLNKIDIFFSSFKYLLASDTVVHLKHLVEDYKQRNGLIYYDDMLIMVLKALDHNVNHNASLLLRSLRERYTYALVDEFQDTDHIQWQIFNRIFVEDSHHSGNRLIVIGDPKQAIYGFRGADIYAYFRAKMTLLGRSDVHYYSLNTNWRSMPDMIETLNPIFSSSRWFSSHDDNHAFLPVISPETNRKVELLVDDSDRQAVTVVKKELEVAKNCSSARKLMAEFTAREIKRLLDEKLLYFKMGNDESWIQANDICILFRKATEARHIEKSLRSKNIPYSYYKKPGLYQSDEALHLSFLLQAIARPNDTISVKKALLTDFFDISANKIQFFDYIRPDHTIIQLFQTWHEYSKKRQWNRMFKSILEDTGILLRQMSQSDGERITTNYNHLIQELVFFADESKMDIVDICLHLENCRKQNVDIERDANLHRLETDEPKVQIMTIHSCKGLEFPVVFLAGGFTASKEDDVLKVHVNNNDGDTNITYDFEGSYKTEYLKECEEEERRLYYVALTRAMYKLYIPYFEYEGKSKLMRPVSDLITPSLAEAYEIITNQIRVIDKSTDPIPNKNVEEPRAYNLEPLLPKLKFNFWKRKIDIESFSKLQAKQTAGRLAMSDIIEDDPFETDEQFKDDDDVELDTGSSPNFGESDLYLPRGPHMGNLVHKILENIDFSVVYQASSPEELLSDENQVGNTIKQWMSGFITRFGEQESRLIMHEALAKMIWNTFHVSLKPFDFQLGALKNNDKIHELEFYYRVLTENKTYESHSAKKALNYVKGYIDLVFIHKDRIYIVDWKTNYLTDGYQESAIMKCMHHHNYFLQYKLYALALNCWLKQMSRPLQLGGVYYLFMRGIDSHDSEKGIFFEEFNSPKVINFEIELNQLFSITSKPKDVQ